MGMQRTDEVTEALHSLDLNATDEEQLPAAADGLPSLTSEDPLPGLTDAQLEGLLALQQHPPYSFDEAKKQSWKQSNSVYAFCCFFYDSSLLRVTLPQKQAACPLGDHTH